MPLTTTSVANAFKHHKCHPPIADIFRPFFNEGRTNEFKTKNRGSRRKYLKRKKTSKDQELI